MLPSPIFQTDKGKLYKGDCLKNMPTLPSESIDCFFADPPFNLNKSYGSSVNDNLAEGKYLQWCYDWIDEGIRLLKPGGSFFLYNLPKWNIPLSNHIAKQLIFKNWIAIEIKFSLPIQGRLYPSHYSLLYYVKGKKPNTFNPPRVPLQICRHCGGEIKDYGGYKNKLNPKGINLSDVWSDIPPVRHKKYKNREANALSLKLMDRILDISTKEGDIVLDPFGGSGTTYIAAELKKRKWIGIELSTTDEIVNRFSNIAIEREYYDALQENKNVLFTKEALKLRKKNGKHNGKYNIEHQHEPTQEPLLDL
ncbi:MAG: BamHI-like protein site-specific methyltransferase [uncultured bacterium]|nr:MAG: BamHI-like protein site-specific methyltransferase [uncultured bacterium]